MKPGVFTQLIIHLVFSTKYGERLLKKEIRPEVFSYISGIITNRKHKSIIINGMLDHIHILISLHPEQNVSKVVQLFKGESSYWVNKNKLKKTKFEWQSEYLAVSVSESVVNKVKKYIQNQEEHHRKKDFKEELNGILQQLGYSKIGG